MSGMTPTVRAGLQILLQLLERRKDRIKKAASLTKIQFHPPQDSYFSVQVWWGKGETLIKRFNYDDHYRWGSPGGVGPRLKSTPCRISQQFIQEILSHRGI